MSYRKQTPVVLLIYTVKSGKSIGSDKGKKISRLKVKDPLSFEIWIFLFILLSLQHH
jgi:hypothetical protein